MPLLRLLLALPLTTLALSACSAAQESVRDESGAITEANDSASVFAMEIGDCYDDPGTGAEAEEFETLPAVPCGDPHDFEVYAATTLDDGDFPGVEAVDAEAIEFCEGEFDSFIGLAYDDSALDFTYFFPTEQTWGTGDREITCLAGDPEGQITDTLEGAER